MAYNGLKCLLPTPSYLLRPPVTHRLCFSFRNFSGALSVTAPASPSVLAAASRRRRSHLKQSSVQPKRGVVTRRKERFDKKKFPMEDDYFQYKSIFNKKRLDGLDKEGPKQLKLKSRTANPVNTVCYVQILGTGMDTQDTSPSVFLFFDNQRFLFNVGEGFQRYCTEYKFKLSRLDHLFLSRVCSETTGGLPGLLLTMANIGEEGMTVNIWGPSDLDYLTGAMRSFIPHSAVLHTHSFHTSSTHDSLKSETDAITLVENEVVKISAVVLLPRFKFSGEDLPTNKNIFGDDRIDQSKNKSAMEISEANPNSIEWMNTMDTGENAQCWEDMKNTSKRPCFGLGLSAKDEETKLERPGSYMVGDVSVVYICELPEIKGKFDPEKARALGLRPGPKYRQLQLGNSVMSDKGNTMVHPSDVLGPSIPGPVVILVDCPTVSHLPALLSASCFNKIFSSSNNESMEFKNHVTCIIHLSPCSVTDVPHYKEWMSKFGDTQHIMAGHKRKAMEFPILRSSERISTRLNFLCPQVFPVSTNLGKGSSEITVVDDIKTERTIPADNLLKFWIRPYSRLGLDRSDIPSAVNASALVEELVEEIPEIKDASKMIAQIFCQPEKQSGLMEQSEIKCKTYVEGENKQNHGLSMESEIKAQASDFSGISDGASSETETYDTELKLDPIPECLENIARDEMEIVFLGTGSSQPSKYRNVSSIFINLFSRGGVLLDCGEGTLAQLKRRFGVKGADEILKNLNFIWISHIHADHHAGIARILSLRKQLLQNEVHEPLLVIGPRPLKRFLDAYSRLEDLGMQFLDCRETTNDALKEYDRVCSSGLNQIEFSKQDSTDNHDTSACISLISKGESKMQSFWARPCFEEGQDIVGLQKFKEVLLKAGLETLTSVPVVHCPQAFAVVLQAQSKRNSVDNVIPGWKLAYSGDTRPCQALVDAAAGATVLIHEATFDDSLVEEAILKNHSLTKEAVDVGVSAGAYRIILTHFSQRYPKIPVFDESYTDRTCIAFDLMSVNLADLPFISKINPYLKLLFKDELAMDEENLALEEENEKWKMLDEPAIAR